MISGAGPFLLKPNPENDKKIGVLLFHGWSSSPFELRKLAQFLCEKGYTVHAPLLPGHGTVWQDLYKVGWKDWEKAANEAYLDFKKKVERVFIGGVSMGGNLAVNVAAGNPEMQGIILMGMPLRLRSFYLRFFLPILRIVHPENTKRYSNYVRKEILEYKKHYWKFPTKSVGDAIDGMFDSKEKLQKVECPALVMQSTRDQLLKDRNVKKVFSLLKTPKDKKELVWIKDSDHTFIVDIYAEQIFEKILEFIEKNVG
ncbi:MAG: alpha/beta fold hydrolase [bacterium]